jgi:hypothetical protein
MELGTISALCAGVGIKYPHRIGTTGAKQQAHLIDWLGTDFFRYQLPDKTRTGILTPPASLQESTSCHALFFEREPPPSRFTSVKASTTQLSELTERQQ